MVLPSFVDMAHVDFSSFVRSKNLGALIIINVLVLEISLNDFESGVGDSG